MSIFSQNIDFYIIIFLFLVIIFILFRGVINAVKDYKKILKVNSKLIRVISIFAIVIEISIITIMIGVTANYINKLIVMNKVEAINGTINEKIKVDDLDVTLNSITKKEEICGINYADECIQPTQKYLIVINITIKNNGTENHSETVFNHELKDSNKNDYIQENAWSGNGEYNPIATILPGKAVNMNIIYDVKDADNYYFYYTNQNTANNIKFNIANNDIK